MNELPFHLIFSSGKPARKSEKRGSWAGRRTTREIEISLSLFPGRFPDISRVFSGSGKNCPVGACAAGASGGSVRGSLRSRSNPISVTGKTHRAAITPCCFDSSFPAKDRRQDSLPPPPLHRDFPGELTRAQIPRSPATAAALCPRARALHVLGETKVERGKRTSRTTRLVIKNLDRIVKTACTAGSDLAIGKAMIYFQSRDASNDDSPASPRQTSRLWETLTSDLGPVQFFSKGRPERFSPAQISRRHGIRITSMETASTLQFLAERSYK